MSTPLVTVGLQFHNNASTLGPAIRSILQQSYPHWELVLHDDGSTDESAEMIRRLQDPRIRLFQDRAHHHRSFRLNQSLDVSQGQYYAVMDGDDIAYPERLATQVGFLERYTEIHLVGGGMLVFRDQGRPIGKRQPPVRHDEICAHPWRGFPIAHPTIMGRMDWFRKHRYDEAYPRVEDHDLLLRSYRQSCFANLPDIVMGYRENQLRLRKVLRDRFYLTRSICRQMAVEKRAWMDAAVIPVQLLKATVEAIAIGTGLEYRILRHHATGITDGEREQWRQVYQSAAEKLVSA
jgi:glycosyltransferase involved in cell wall biosynthesis